MASIAKCSSHYQRVIIFLASGNQKILQLNPPGTSCASWVACGSYHAFAVCEGQLYSWGRTEGGQLGLASEVIESHIEARAVLHFGREKPVGMCGVVDSFCFSYSF